MPTSNLSRFLIFGQLQRDFILPPSGIPFLDQPGGSLLYAAAGLRVWENEIGLVAHIGEDYPQAWIGQLHQYDIDTSGIEILPEAMDVRHFLAYEDLNTRTSENPVEHFVKLELPIPRVLLGYKAPILLIDSRARSTSTTLRIKDVPGAYLDANAAHFCPGDYLTHSLLPSALRVNSAITLSMDAGEGYMNPSFWDDMPAMLNNLTVFHTNEEKIRSLFQGKSTDLWEMAETIASYGCEIVVIKRGAGGQYVYNEPNKNRWIVPAYPARIIDPTGAGDAFCGGFLAGYHQTYDALQADLFGNIAASLCVEGSGPLYALDAMPGLAQARLEALKGMVRKA